MLGSAFAMMALGVLLGLLSFAGSIWLIVVAFRKGGPLWGFLTLFVPFANIVFAVKFWPDAKKPFLASLVPGFACGLCFFLAGGMAASAVGGEMARQIQEDMAKEQARMTARSRAPRTVPTEVADEAEPAEPMREADEPGSAPFILNTLPPPPVPATEFDPETITRDGYAPVSFPDAKKYIGRAVKVVTRGGRTHRGTLTAARTGAIEVEQYLGACSISVEFASREVETVLVDAR